MAAPPEAVDSAAVVVAQVPVAEAALRWLAVLAQPVLVVVALAQRAVLVEAALAVLL